MSLLFGYLMQDFVDFSIFTNNLDSNDPNSAVKLNQTAKAFCHVVANDVSYLTYISTLLITQLLHYPGSKSLITIVQGLFVSTYLYMCSWVYNINTSEGVVHDREGF